MKLRLTTSGRENTNTPPNATPVKKGKRFVLKSGSGSKVSIQTLGYKETLRALCDKLYPIYDQEIAFHKFIPMLYKKGLNIPAIQLSTYSDNLNTINDITLLATCLQDSKAPDMKDAVILAFAIHAKYWNEIYERLYEMEEDNQENWSKGTILSIGAHLRSQQTNKEHHAHMVMGFKELVARNFIPRDELWLKDKDNRGKWIISSNLNIHYPRLFNSMEDAGNTQRLVATKNFTRLEKL